jgi:aminomethyltransferase
VVDDLIAYVKSEEEIFLIPNAANTTEVVRRLAAAAPAGITVTNQHSDFAVLAVQGPRSADLVKALGFPADHDYMAFATAGWNGNPLTVCRTGYTGEHGYELVCRWQDADELWGAILRAGEPFDIKPCGLGARDTLRTEMGYPLHGQDLSLDITPVQARAGWAVGWKKEAFWGREALLAEKAAGPRRLLWGLRQVDRAIPRPHMAVYDTSGVDEAGTVIGEVTSGTFSPSLKVGIALALLPPTAAEGDTVYLDVRGRRVAFTVTKPPFVTRRRDKTDPINRQGDAISRQCSELIGALSAYRNISAPPRPYSRSDSKSGQCSHPTCISQFRAYLTRSSERTPGTGQTQGSW